MRNGFKVGAGMGYTMMVGLFLIAANGVVGGGFTYFLFSPPPGEMIQFDEYFSDGLKPPTSVVCGLRFFHFFCSGF